jgi:hypothetical protein
VADEREHPKAVEQTIQEEAGLPENWQPVNSAPVNPNVRNFGGPPTASTGIDNFQSGQLPPFLGLSPDLVDAGTPGSGVPTDRLMPIAPGGVSQNVATVKSVAQPLIDAAIAKIPLPTPAAPPPAFQLVDNFHAAMSSNNIGGTIPIVSIGQLGWALLGVTTIYGGQMGGGFPHLGQYAFANNAVVSEAGWLTFAGSGSFSNAEISQLTWPLADYPGATLTYIFKLEAVEPESFSSSFSMAQSVLYVGLTGNQIDNYIGSSVSRPSVFIGVRYDTSTTAPSINDSFFTLEVVTNPYPEPSVRNNTQGVTLVTNIAPTQGVWHTLTISFAAGGIVTVTLDGTFVLTTPLPAMSITPTNASQSANGYGTLNWTVNTSGIGPWGTGSIITSSGFTGAATLMNGTWPLVVGVDASVGFDYSTPVGLNFQAGTLSGFPSLIPIFMMGNDDTASPSGLNRLMIVDFWSMNWSPS